MRASEVRLLQKIIPRATYDGITYKIVAKQKYGQVAT
jgi:hypothetical protein